MTTHSQIAVSDAPKAADFAAVLSYDPLTGIFLWKVDRGQRVTAGDVAGGVSPDGYHQITVFGQKYVAHRIAWLLSFGEWPAGQIDHVNGDRLDNRLANLRDCSIAENAQNRALGDGAGTYFSRGGWVSHLKVDGVSFYLGKFDTRDEAHAAYCGAKRLAHRFSPVVRYAAAEE